MTYRLNKRAYEKTAPSLLREAYQAALADKMQREYQALLKSKVKVYNSYYKQEEADIKAAVDYVLSKQW